MIKTQGYVFTPQINMKGNLLLLRRRLTLTTYIFYPLTIALAAVLITYEPGKWQLPALIIVFLLLRPVMVYRGIRNSSRPPYNKFANHLVSFEIDDICISEKIENGVTTTLNWNHVDKAIKGKDFYLVISGTQNPFYIPESAFATLEELSRFKAILESKYLLTQ